MSGGKRYGNIKIGYSEENVQKQNIRRMRY